VAEGEVGPKRRPWHATWFLRALVLLALGLALVAFGEVRVIAAGGGGGAPAPILPDYAALLPNLAVLSGSLLALVGGSAALVTTCAALLDAVRVRRGRVAATRSPVPGAEDRRR
jgi:hypothetical protein